MTDPTGRSLDVALAKAMGWGRWNYGLWAAKSGKKMYALPTFHVSIDALIRDVLPVCRERGAWTWSLLCDGVGPTFRAEVYANGDIYPSDEAPQVFAGYESEPAHALALACLRFLEEAK